MFVPHGPTNTPTQYSPSLWWRWTQRRQCRGRTGRQLGYSSIGIDPLIVHRDCAGRIVRDEAGGAPRRPPLRRAGDTGGNTRSYWYWTWWFLDAETQHQIYRRVIREPEPNTRDKISATLFDVLFFVWNWRYNLVKSVTFVKCKCIQTTRYFVV